MGKARETHETATTPGLVPGAGKPKPLGYANAPTREQRGAVGPVAVLFVVSETDARVLAEAGGPFALGEAIGDAVERLGLNEVLRRLGVRA